MEIRSGNRIRFVDDCRVWAIIMIVAYHMIYPLFHRLPNSYGVLGAVCEAGTMMFVLLAAILLRRQMYNISYCKLLWRKVKYILLPYMTASLLIMLLRAVKDGNLYLAEFPVSYLNAVVLGSASTPLWFIPMLWLFFLLTPLWKSLCRCNAEKYMLPTLVLPFIVERAKADCLLTNIIYFLPFFILGLWLPPHLPKLKELIRDYKISRKIVSLTLISLFSTIVFPQIDQLQTMAKMFVAGQIFLFFLGYEHKHDESWIQVNIVRNGLLIYFYHGVVINTVFSPILRKISVAMPEWAALLLWLIASMACLGVLGLLFSAVNYALHHLQLPYLDFISGVKPRLNHLQDKNIQDDIVK